MATNVDRGISDTEAFPSIGIPEANFCLMFVVPSSVESNFRM